MIEITIKNISDLKPYENNPRNNAAAVSYVANSIKEFGFKNPVIIDKDNVVIAGHTRLKAAEQLGIEDIPCVMADDLTEEQVRAFRLADNKSAEMSTWDDELLTIELEDIKTLDMTDFGFDPIETEAAAEEDDFEIEVPEEPRAKHGDLYELGEHRLMCGDSSDEACLRILMGGSQGDMVFTDPPYGVAIGDKNKMLNEKNGTKSISENIIGDTLGEQELHDILVKAFNNLRNACSPECSYYVSAPQVGSLVLMMMMMMKEAGLEVRHNLIWKKNAPTFSMGRLDYDYKHEPIFYTWTKKHNFYGGADNTVWEFDKPRKCDLHPTMKPVELIAKAVNNSSRKGDIVVDIFGGSGSTMIACEQLGRRCFMMELDPHYVDVIIDRWEQYTGKKAVLVSSAAER